MKNRRIFAGILILVVLALFTNWALRQRRTSRPPASGPDDAATASNTVSPTTPTAATRNQGQRLPSGQSSAGTNDALEHIQVEHRVEEMFKTPIAFYGKVVDENRNPVAEAGVSFSWNKLAASHQFETGRADTKSDGNGFFLLEGQNGEGLDVRVSKPGYYAAKSNAMSFQYSQASGMPVYLPDRNNPMIFTLLKRGSGASLITSKSGMGDDFGISVPRDGTPLKVDLLSRKTGEGPLEITQVKPDPKLWKQAMEWSFQMAIPDGGFAEYQNQDFPFEAPDAGYQPIVQFNFQKGQTNWTEAVAKDFYIRFSNPPIYGRLHIETSISGGVRLTYAVNPDGSRNLESQ